MSDPEFWFYQLQRSSAARALPPLLEKTRARGWRALVRAREPARIEELDDALWTYRDAAFLPHGRADEPYAERQPVLLTLSDANANAAEAVFLLDGAEPPSDLHNVARCVIMFDAADDHAVKAARARWKERAAAGAAVQFWREAEDGRWVKHA